MIGRRFGRYRPISPLGQGGLATVWRAQDELLGRVVALKLLHEHLNVSTKARKRFLHEAQTYAALDHPGIVAVHDAGEDDGRAYIALGLIEGETVSEMAARRLMPAEDAARIALAAAEALGYAHGRRVFHRDVTGRNIMVRHDGRVLMLDFGLALAAWESRLTSTEAPMGTVHYMAPEVIRGLEADARSDLYSLGVVLYEMLTGTFPFVGDQPAAVLYAAANLDPVPPRARRPELAQELESFVLRAIARDPEARPQAADEFLRELRALGPRELAPSIPAVPIRTTVGERSSDRALADAPTSPIQPRFIAVLPFQLEHATDDPERVGETLSHRLGETIGCALSAGGTTHVVPVPSGELPSDARELARRLGANLLLRGSVHRHGMQVRVNYALTDPWAGLQLAGDVVTGSALQPFDVEDRVVESVRRAMGSGAGVPLPRSSRPPDPAADDHFRQALGYMKRYDNEASVDGAISLLERLVDSNGEVGRYHAALARAYLHKHQLTRERLWEARAAAACARAVALDPDGSDVRLALGHLKLESGQLAASREEFERALAADALSLEAQLGLARALADDGRLGDALEVSAAAADAQPGDWRAHSMLGFVLFRQSRFKEALGPWRRAVDLTPDNARAQRNLGTAFFRLGQLQAAAAAYRLSLSIQPSDEAYSNLGATLFAMGEFEEAITAFRTAVALTTGDPLRWGNLGVACRWAPGHTEEAEVHLDRAIGLMRERLERNPARADWWAQLAGWLVERDRFDEARETIRHALAMDPNHVECMLRAGDVYHRLGEREQCLTWFRRARDAGCGLGELRRSPALADLRADPEFIRILGSEE